MWSVLTLMVFLHHEHSSLSTVVPHQQETTPLAAGGASWRVLDTQLGVMFAERHHTCSFSLQTSLPCRSVSAQKSVSYASDGCCSKPCCCWQSCVYLVPVATAVVFRSVGFVRCMCHHISLGCGAVEFALQKCLEYRQV